MENLVHSHIQQTFLEGPIKYQSYQHKFKSVLFS